MNSFNIGPYKSSNFMSTKHFSKASRDNYCIISTVDRYQEPPLIFMEIYMLEINGILKKYQGIFIN